MKKIVITGGHLTPAIAVIEELKKRGDWQIYFIGRKYSAEGVKTPSVETTLIPQLGVNFNFINPGRLQRRFSRWTIPAALRIPAGFFQSFLLIRRIKPDLILSFGGYVGVPIVIAGWLLGIPCITHEQTSIVGLGTKINSYFARKVALSWPGTMAEFPVNKAVFTGNPIRKSIFNKPDEQIWKSFGLSEKYPIIFVTGGNQGSLSLNLAIKDCLNDLLKVSNVVHQCGHINGPNNYELFLKIKKQLFGKIAGGYQVFEYLPEREMATVLKKADLVISRAGANIIFELLVLNKPCLLVPLPWLYRNEQQENALYAKKIGVAEILEQANLTGNNLLAKVEFMLANLNKYKIRFDEVSNIVVKDAAANIVRLVENTLDES